MEWLRGVWLVFQKDILFELENWETVSLLLVFALAVLFLFNFSFDLSQKESLKFIPGFFWLTILFTSVLGFTKAIEIERRENAIQGILLTPIPRESIYIGKVLSSFLFLLIVELILFPLFFVFMSLRIPLQSMHLFLVPIVLGSLGLSALGTFMALICQVSPRGGILFSLGYFPLAVPILISVTKMFQGVLSPSVVSVQPWLRFLIVIVVVELVSSVLLFEYLMEE